MSIFDAICHAFSTVSIGGFSTYDASIGHFNSPLIDMLAVIFMFIAGVNFSLHFLAWRHRSVGHYLLDPEFRTYLKFLVWLTLLVLLYLYWTGHYSTFLETVTKGLFQVISIGTTTGFTTTDFTVWPGALPVILILSSFIGGCAGSTAGGIKVIRWLLMYRQGIREVQRLVHPSAEIPVKLGSKVVHHRVVEAVWGFFAVYIVVFGVLLIVQLASGLDQVSSFAAVAATLNNLGPGLGEVASGFAGVGIVGKWSAVCGMLLGRLEIFTFLVLITPTFWRP
jgi:trk system potassium uptake protein TrkH